MKVSGVKTAEGLRDALIALYSGRLEAGMEKLVRATERDNVFTDAAALTMHVGRMNLLRMQIKELQGMEFD